uniref:Poly(A) binding protein interacting protein 2B n=1 Tax=Oncorhynchus kisutch TaxID=8019 RepID=A0A8C7N550_ONCKI
MSGPEVAKTPGGRAPGKEGMEAVANGHAGEGEQGGDDPFAEYMWMENEDAYNRQVEEELLEQEFLERCFQEMLDEEDQDWFIPARDLPSGMGQLHQQLNGLSVSDRGNAEEMAKWKKNWFVLYPASQNGIARLEFYDCSGGGASDKPNTKKLDKKVGSNPGSSFFFVLHR